MGGTRNDVMPVANEYSSCNGQRRIHAQPPNHRKIRCTVHIRPRRSVRHRNGTRISIIRITTGSYRASIRHTHGTTHLPLAALYLIAMVAIHAYARPEAKVYSQVALVFMTILAAITTSVHFVILTVGHQLEATGQSWVPLVISFRWPSVLYTLDILAWDWFFALSLLFASVVFTEGRLERAVRMLLIVSGVLSLVGLVGVPLSDMDIRNIGIVGYAVVSPVAFLLIGVLFGRPRTEIDSRGHIEETRSPADH